MKKSLDNAAIFAMAYAICVLPSYVMSHKSSSEAVAAGGFDITLLIYSASVIAVCAICVVRGKLVDKNWLVLLPMVAFAFEFISKLSVIPYIPTMYHMLAIIVGASSAVVTQAKPPFANTL